MRRVLVEQILLLLDNSQRRGLRHYGHLGRLLRYLLRTFQQWQTVMPRMWHEYLRVVVPLLEVSRPSNYLHLFNNLLCFMYVFLHSCHLFKVTWLDATDCLLELIMSFQRLFQRNIVTTDSVPAPTHRHFTRLRAPLKAVTPPTQPLLPVLLEGSSQLPDFISVFFLDTRVLLSSCDVHITHHRLEPIHLSR